MLTVDILLEGWLLAKLVYTTHSTLVCSLLLLVHGLGGSKGHALACHLTLLLSSSALHH